MQQPPRTYAERIFRAAIDAVDSERLVRENVSVDAAHLRIADRTYDLTLFDRIVVVGGGKAGAGMATGVIAAVADVGVEAVGVEVAGQVNVPEDCVRDLEGVKLVGARPAGINEPTARGVAATQAILDLVSRCGPRDLCLVLLSGGGSALLPAPIEGLTLETKRSAVAMLAGSGASIHELNTVRRRLSRVKGGGLLQACTAGAVEVLVISDVVGSDLATIASGPTVIREEPDDAAEKVFRRYVPDELHWPEGLAEVFARPADIRSFSDGRPVHHTIIGSNAVAVAAAEHEANRLGCDVVALGCDHVGEAGNEGRRWARQLKVQRERRRGASRPLCLVDGGEPVVTLAKTGLPRKGGRNQELVLAAIDEMAGDDWTGLALLSVGTDGEDGPTDAAGAVADSTVVAKAIASELDTRSFLEVNNSYPFFAATGGLLITGPTHTNVMDVRIGIVMP